MDSLYNRISALCQSKAISGYRLCKDIGIQPSILTDLKKGRQSGLSAQNAEKIASYFGVSVGYLLGTEAEKTPTPEGERVIDDEFVYAMSRESPHLSERSKDQLRAMARFLAEQDAKER